MFGLLIKVLTKNFYIMATVNYYLSRYIKKDSQRGEIQLRFSGNRNFVKRAGTGIFITAGNWDAERGMPKARKSTKNVDNNDEIRDRLLLLTGYLIRCWEETGEGELKDDSLAEWLRDIEWKAEKEESILGGRLVIINRWTLNSKTQLAEKAEAKKREMARFENQYFVDAFGFFMDEQFNNGVIVAERRKSYNTCMGLWDRMEKFQGKHNKIKEMTTEVLYDFKNFILNECDLWEFRKEKQKNGESIDKWKPKKRFEAVYQGYDYVLRRGVERRSLNYVANEFKYIRAFWYWIMKVQKCKVDDIFENYVRDQSVYGTPFFFSKEDRDKLFKADFSKRPGLGVQRDIFVFQSLVGCRIGDLKRLKKANVVDGDYLQYVAGKTRNKTGKVVTVPLHPTAKIIIERYKNLADDRLLPFISDQKYNDAIKEMFLYVPSIDRIVTVLDPVTRLEKQVRLSEVASSHMGRRNFCGNLYEAGFRDADIASMSGHSEGSRAIARYRKVSDQQKQRMIKKL